MEPGTELIEGAAEATEDGEGAEGERDLVSDGAAEPGERRSAFPPVIERAADAEADLSKDEILDATDWLLASDEVIQEDAAPTTVKIDTDRGLVEWKLRPLTDDEFQMCRRASMGTNREQRRKLEKGQLADLVNEKLYQRLVVALATVHPDLVKAADVKQTTPQDILEHRFQFRPGWISELAGVVNDISGFDPSKIEVVSDAAGNS